MGEALTIEVRHEQGCAIVTAGEIDISTSKSLFKSFASTSPPTENPTATRPPARNYRSPNQGGIANEN
jgi:hypothetical protein